MVRQSLRERERCGERRRAGNTKKEMELGKDERKWKMREEKKGNDGRLGVSLPSHMFSRFYEFFMARVTGLDIPPASHVKARRRKWK